MSTDDAMVWATEFCRTFKGWTVTDVAQDVQGIVDPGGMVGWFANAMQAGVNQYERRRLRAKDELSNIFESTGETDANPA